MRHHAELVDGYRKIRTPFGIYNECKSLDQDPREGMFGVRVVRFYHVHDRQMFYEPVTSYERIAEIVRHNAMLLYAGVPQHALPWIQVGFRAFGSARSAPAGVIQMPSPGEAAAGHAVLLNNGLREDMLGFVNSWGAGWGAGGHGWLPRQYLEHYLMDAWLTQDARVGPTRHKYARMLSGDSRQLAALWMMQNPRWTFDTRHNGLRHRMANFETLSRNDDSVVNVFEVRTGYGRLIAWAHLFTEGRCGLLKEFFVALVSALRLRKATGANGRRGRADISTGASRGLALRLG